MQLEKSQLEDLWKILSYLTKYLKQDGCQLIKYDFDYINSWISVYNDPDWRPYLSEDNMLGIIDIAKLVG